MGPAPCTTFSLSKQVRPQLRQGEALRLQPHITLGQGANYKVVLFRSRTPTPNGYALHDSLPLGVTEHAQPPGGLAHRLGLLT